MKEKQFNNIIGANKIYSPKNLTLLLLLITALGIGISQVSIFVGFSAIIAPLIMLYISSVFQKPNLVFYSALIMAFVALGLTKYYPAPLGLSIDFLLLIGWICVFFNKKEINWSNLNNGYCYAVLLWFGWVCFEIINPEAKSILAWFFAMRGIGLYSLLTIPLCFIIFNKSKHQEKFINIWFTIAILGTLWGCRQLYFGLNGAENAWLAEGNSSTHILHGKLRVFSFFSDAGQFGASQAHTFLVATVLTLGPYNKKRKFFYSITAICTFWGMMISGTRGAIIIPVIGFLIYAIMTKKIKILFLGILIGLSVFAFLKYTYILQSNYQVARMRTALNPNNASFNVRIENQKKLYSYLKPRPIGGGIGSAGYWGLRFSPNTFLARTPTDSWYVQIWAENGIVGLFLYVCMLIYFLIKGFITIWKLQDPSYKQIAVAFYAGFLGIIFASYGNKVLGQMPTGILIYISIAFIHLSTKFEKQTNQLKNGLMDT